MCFLFLAFISSKNSPARTTGGAYLHTSAGTVPEVPDTSQCTAARAALDIIAAVWVIAGSARSMTGLTHRCPIPSAEASADSIQQS
ncbi:MAG: hypothetical protein AB2L14_04780 [Candidatus Xenobiia bacterium LiM19]